MKVLLLFTFSVSLTQWDEIGIIGREILIYKKLQEKGVKITFLTYGDNKDLEYERILNIPVIPVKGLIESRLPYFNLIKSIFLPLKLRSAFQNIDIIKTNQINGGWVSFLAKILYKKKILVRLGVEWLAAHKNVAKKDGFYNYLKYLYGYLSIFLKSLVAYKLADQIIVTSEYDIPFIIKHFRLKRKYKQNKIHLISNYIDDELFKPNIVKIKDRHILYIGLLHRGKNIVNLVKAFKELNDFTLDIIGHGPQEGILRCLKKDFDLKVNFLGRFPNKELPNILNQYEIFILPSISEGNPKALLEAMSCGLACIGSNIKGITNIIKHNENGYLCNLDPESIRNAILEVYNDKELKKKMGQNARKHIIENNSIKIIVNKEYSLYKEIMKETI